MVLYMIIFILLMVNMLFVSKYPMLFKLLMAKRIVWKILADGSLLPTPAVQAGIAYKTKDLDEYFEYERSDVVYFGKTPGILAYAPYSRALNPENVAHLSYLKRLGINDIHAYKKIVNSVEMTPEEYEKELAEMEAAEDRENGVGIEYIPEGYE